jgi:hypothetical protein
MTMVYENTVDNGEFHVSVEQTGEYQGQLKVKVVETGQILLDEQVGLAYGARFGPDVADVYSWQERAIEVIDKYIEKRK